MKLLLVLGDDDSHKLIAHYVKSLGFEVIRYTHILKAMDNIDEIDPNAIIISARDFPRHWKTMVQFVRNERAKDACPIILLTGENFPVEEASKASFLGISGSITETLENSTQIRQLQEILTRYIPMDEKYQDHHFYTEFWQKFGFVFVHPENLTLITGEVKDISSDGLSFLPDNSSLVIDMTLNMKLSECSLRAGDSILSPVCRLTRKGPSLSMAFLSFPIGEQAILNKYMESLRSQKQENEVDTTS
jgi:methylmalonyl-CoA mutase cobalamin-binding subunit